jgi:hypothetical protein
MCITWEMQWSRCGDASTCASTIWSAAPTDFIGLAQYEDGMRRVNQKVTRCLRRVRRPRRARRKVWNLMAELDPWRNETNAGRVCRGGYH